jgi:hypothetical protein
MNIHSHSANQQSAISNQQSAISNQQSTLSAISEHRFTALIFATA